MEGGVSRFPVDTFLSHSAETFRRGILCCCLNFGYREGLDKREGGNQDIPSKKHCLTVPELSRRESFFVALISGIAKVWIIGGRSIQISRRQFFVTQCRKFTSGNILLLHYLWVAKKFG